ncbi:MAG: butyryl-CoA:acetate CoA-transferase [Lachnospiraceae bacterium]|nr:butyryl-CoA:acetate CoA-transferase [Lachnospiraceae bacterium]
MDYQKKYQEKLVSAEKAAELVKSGDWVDFAWTATTPKAFDKALAKRMPELTDIKFRGGILMHEPEIFKIDKPEEHFCWNSWHFGGLERKAAAKGLAYYAGFRYSEAPRYYYDSTDPLDVAVIMVSPMDAHGYFNFGPSCSHLRAVVETANKVVLEVNPSMPVCFGSADAYVHIDEVDYVIEGIDEPLDAFPPAGEATEVDKKVAELVVKELSDGCCLQLGIGGMPNAIGKMIAESDLKDLGVHTEMYVDAFVELSKRGKITGKHKTIDRGLQTYAFAAGTPSLYEFLDHNPECMTTNVGYVNDVRTIAQIDNFISINNAIDVDLFGQVSAESSGYTHISGAGGQLDFVLGAYLSKGGKSFMCISSTFMDKKEGKLKSRIVPTLTPGSVVTDTRANAMYIVTEHGIASMKGKTTWQRTEALIGVAHPDFRDELIAEAEKMRIWRRSNKR